MRRVAVLLVFLAVSAVAQDVMPASENPVLEARVESTTVLDVEDLATADPRGTVVEAANDPTTCRSLGTITPLTDFAAFRFNDESSSASCAEAQILAFVPQGATTMTVHFQADRVIRDYAGQALVRPEFRQELRVWTVGGELVDRTSFFDPFAEASAEDQTKDILMRLPSDQDQVIVGWFFQDVSTTPDTGAPAGPSMESTVRSPRIAFPPILVTDHEVRDLGSQEREMDVLHTIQANITLAPEQLYAQNTRLSVDVLSSQSLASVRLPGGTELTPEDVTQVVSGGVRTITLSPGRSSTPGTYSFQLESTSALPPLPPEAPPTTIYPLVWAALFVPVVGGVIAGTQQEVFRRRRMPAQDRDWNRMLVTLTLIWLGYAAYWILLVSYRALAPMATLPVNAKGTFFWAALGLLLGLFLIHWGFGSMRTRYARELRHADRLERTNEELQRSNKELEQFAYLASHDLQEPLRKISGYTTLLQRRYEGRLDARADQYIEATVRSTDRARRLIGDVLAFSRIDSHVEKGDVDLDRIMDDLRTDLPPELRRTGAVIENRHLGVVHGNPTLLRQLLENLVGNAIKYADPERPPRVRVSARPVVGALEVSVADNGIGIAPEYHDKVFALFHRLHGHQSTYEGTGIGLAICKKIVETHGGTIRIESTPGKGSTFIFTIAHGGVQ